MSSGDEDGLKPYQRDALAALERSPGPVKALILPTGRGKTRVVVKYAQKRMEAGESVAYVVESDAHAEQVRSECAKVGVEAAHIQGATVAAAVPGGAKKRQADLDDYDEGMTLGVFTYHSYWLGARVPRAVCLIIDDAHALRSQDVSLSAVEIAESEFRPVFRKLMELIKATNPLLAPQIDALARPVHRGGEAILVPPSEDPEFEEHVREHVGAASTMQSYPAKLLRDRLAASPHFMRWPLVITAGSLTWRPFILPFESFGSSPNQPRTEREVILSTATRGTDDFLSLRLGLTDTIQEPRMPPVGEMGWRLVLAYPEYTAASPPSEPHVNIIKAWATAFGSVLVTVTADEAEGRLSSALAAVGIATLRYQAGNPLQAFEALPTPRALVLVNRPSGVDIPASLCPVAIHLDLPYSTSGHEVVAGDIERLGSVAQASLAIRLSQLLGRLNRKETDRSVHILLGPAVPLERNSVFVKALEPAVLLDFLIGRQLARSYPHPAVRELLADAHEFLKGSDELRRAHMERAERVRESYLAAGAQGYLPSARDLVAANAALARGNFDLAASEFRRFSLEAARSTIPAFGQTAFYEFQFGVAGMAGGGGMLDNGGPQGLAQRALSRGPQSKALVGALQQMRAGNAPVDESNVLALLADQQKVQGIRFFESWREEATLPAAGTWTDFWRTRLTAPDHESLLAAWKAGFQILGSNSPRRASLRNNDAKITWPGPDGEVSLALEVKGRTSDGEDATMLVPDHISQAATNAQQIEAHFALLVTSKMRCDREVDEAARSRGVMYLRHDAAIAVADALARQCEIFDRVIGGGGTATDAPGSIAAFQTLLQTAGGEIEVAHVRRAFG